MWRRSVLTTAAQAIKWFSNGIRKGPRMNTDETKKSVEAEIEDPEKRSTLKKLAVGAYVVPVTMALLSSKRAVAQSRPPQPPS